MTNHALLAQDALSSDFKSVHCFAVHAVAEPDVMPRVLELFAKRNLIPTSWHSIVASDRHGNEELQIDIQIRHLETRIADHIARCLRQIANVQTVLTSEKGYSSSAIGA
ncbi:MULTISPECIES: hypothetical protein [unclassified Thalassospira]|uniref:hypothetical protein n=1 Tax=unclassified Thalassospira TaxID=2648997 RepID=UPI000A1D9D55|nr:hypothetical protein [Thalassospira sp. MCCC 1A01428]OSQ46555.1 hypothetical protein THS27_01415 [Thalassospira sp. MCCC 1A01428]